MTLEGIESQRGPLRAVQLSHQHATEASKRETCQIHQALLNSPNIKLGQQSLLYTVFSSALFDADCVKHMNSHIYNGVIFCSIEASIIY